MSATIRLLALLLALPLAACSDEAADTPTEQPQAPSGEDGKEDGVDGISGDSDDDFGPTGRYAQQFKFKDLRGATFIDHAAVPFLATAILQRRDEYDDAAAGNGLILDIFDHVSAVPILFDLLVGLNKWNDAVNDDMYDLGVLAAKAQHLNPPQEDLGFEPCGLEIESRFVNSLVDKLAKIGAFGDIDLQGEDGDLTVAALCGLNRIGPTDVRLLQAVLPDRLTIDVDEPAGWPNGRVLDEPITDMFFSVSFIQQHLRSPLGIAVNHKGNCNGDECSKFSLSQVPMNPTNLRADGGYGSGNDQPYTGKFPYLAEPHVEDPEYVFGVTPRE